MKLVLWLLLGSSLFGQTLGQLRLVDFSPRPTISIAAVSGTTGAVSITLSASMALDPCNCVWIYQPLSIPNDAALANAGRGNTGRGYFVVTVTDSTHFVINTNMYTNQPVDATANGVSVGDIIVPLKTYFLRQGPRVALDGPVNQGTWSISTAYRALDMVQAPDSNWYVANQDNTGIQPPSSGTWEQVNPALVGPGTFTASMRNTSGKASTSNYSFTQSKTLSDTYFNNIGFDWNITNGPHDDLAAWYWLASGNTGYYLSQAQNIAVRATNYADGSVDCDETAPAGYCGRGVGLDYARLDFTRMEFAESVIHYTLSSAQRQTHANMTLGDKSVLNNGVDTSTCNIIPRVSAATSSADQVICTQYDCKSVSGTTHWLSMSGFGPGAAVLTTPYAGATLEVLGTVNQVISDTEFTLNKAGFFSRANSNNLSYALTGSTWSGGVQTVSIGVAPGPNLSGLNWTISGANPSTLNGTYHVIQTQTGKTFHILGASWSGGIETLTVDSDPSLTSLVGLGVLIASAVPSGMNGVKGPVTSVTSNTISYSIASDPGWISGGTVNGGNTVSFPSASDLGPWISGGTIVTNPSFIFGFYTGGYPNTTLSGSNTTWYYNPTWSDAAHYCGVKFYLNHHPSSPAMIPGEESQMSTDWLNGTGLPDWSRINNRTISALAPWIATCLNSADIDIRGVNLCEQSINFYTTQWLAQNVKSSWSAWGGHGPQYGPGRVYQDAVLIAWMIHNSLTVTPPGYLTGNYLQNLMHSYVYQWWNGKPQYNLPYENGYSFAFNSDVQGGNELFNSSIYAMILTYLFPSDPYSPVIRDYLRNRRGDYGIALGAGGWTSLLFQPWPLAFFDPSLPTTSITTLPLQQGIFTSDANECIAASLYCRPDSSKGMMFSTTGNTSTDTQVGVEIESDLPLSGENSYGVAGAIQIIQNNGANSASLLGGNGLNLLTGISPYGGLYDVSMPSIFNTTALDRFTGIASSPYSYASLDRWAGTQPDGVGDDSYAYMYINYNPTVRQAGQFGYTNTTQQYFTVSGQVRDSITHMKSGSNNPNYVIDYLYFSGVATGNQLRHYWHLQDTPNAATNFAAGRNTGYVTTNYGSEEAKLVVPNTGTLSIKALPVAGSVNTTVALTDDSYAPPYFSNFPKQDYAPSTPPTWNSGVATITVAGLPYQNYPLPTDGTASISVSGINSSGPGSFNGTFAVTGYSAASGIATITYNLPNNPGTYVSCTAPGGRCYSYPPWCTWVSPGNVVGSCAGNYPRPSAAVLPDSSWPTTFRLETCASSDSVSCDNETDAEMITVLKPSSSTSDSMPTIVQPTCTGTGGNCTSVQINDSSFPKVWMHARQGALLTSMTEVTTHSGTAQYVVGGLQAGTYNITLNGSPIATAPVSNGDNTLKFNSTSGTIAVTSTGAPSGTLVVAPLAVNMFCTSTGSPITGTQNVSVSETGIVGTNYSATKTSSRFSLTGASGTPPGMVGVSIASCPGAGQVVNDVLTVSTTDSVGNSPQLVSLNLTEYAMPTIINSSPLADGSIGVPYSVGLQGAGGLAPYTFSILSGTICAGLSLSSSGQISGTPTTPQTCSFTVQLVDSEPVTITKPFTITITSGTLPVMGFNPSSLTFACFSGTVANPQNVSFTTTNGDISDWSTSSTSLQVGASPSSGTVEANFTVTSSCVGRSPGIYNDIITVTSNSASNSPQQIQVTTGVFQFPQITLRKVEPRKITIR